VSKIRGNGEGSIHRRKNGGWCAQFVVHTAEGPKRRTLYGKTRQEVANKLAKALSSREDGLVFDAGKRTVGEYLERWLEECVKGTVRASTLGWYKRLGSLVQNTMTSEVRFRAELSEYGVERWQLARV
jgi:integrase